LVPADLACWWLPAECVELASLPWPRSSAIKACGRRRRLAGAAFGGNWSIQPTSPAVPSRLTARHRSPTPWPSNLASTPGRGSPPPAPSPRSQAARHHRRRLQLPARQRHRWLLGDLP